MSNPFVGEIRVVGFNFAPTGWALCAGQLLPLSQNTALFSLLGTFYGGDGKSTFALPNLQDSVALSSGQSPGGSLFDLGQTGGSDNVTLLVSEIPSHNHNVMASTDSSQSSPVNNSPGQGAQVYRATPTTQVLMAAQTSAVTGGSQPHNNRMPYLGLNYIIALQGVFPARQ